MDDFFDQAKNLVVDALLDLKTTLPVTGADLALYLAERARAVAQTIGTDDFADTLKTARDNVALKAGITAVNVADKVDAKALQIIQGGLQLLAGLAAKVA